MEIPNPKGYNLSTILGPTAGGKTAVAANLAFAIGGEVISGDSRQVYRGMDLGTGKDLHDYTVNGKQVPYHLIDIVDAGYQLNVYEYQQHFVEAFNDISGRGAFPILCGGSGMYIEAAIKGYKLIAVPENPELRGKLASLEMHELEEMLKSYKQLHNQTDTVNRKRLVRAIEIEEYYARVGEGEHSYPRLQNIIFGIAFPRHQQRERITQRLKQRLDEGMVDEVKSLLDKGIKPQGGLLRAGVQVDNKVSHGRNWLYRFARLICHSPVWQATDGLVQKMERSGIPIHWIDGNIPLEQKMRRF